MLLVGIAAFFIGNVTFLIVSAVVFTSTGTLKTSIDKEPSFYPFGERLIVYDPRLNLLLPLAEARAAACYFGARRPRSGSVVGPDDISAFPAARRNSGQGSEG